MTKHYAVGILLCPAAGLKSCGNTGLDRTFQPGRGIDLQQRRGLVETVHQIEILNGHPRGAFEQVIRAGEQVQVPT